MDSGGIECIKLAHNLAYSLNNGSFTGWVVELDFIQLIKIGNVEMKDKDGRIVSLEHIPVVYFDIYSLNSILYPIASVLGIILDELKTINEIKFKESQSSTGFKPLLEY